MPASANSSAICFRRSMRSGSQRVVAVAVGRAAARDQHDARHLLQLAPASAAARCRRASRRRCRRSARRAAWCPWHRSAAALAAPPAASGASAASAEQCATPAIIRGRDPSAAACLPLDDMDVEMEHDLAAIGAVIGDQAIAVRLQPELRAPPCRRRARNRRSVSVGAVALKSMLETYSPLGITRTCTGACGLMSWKASA